jgi:single-strand DNA-binding protein
MEGNKMADSTLTIVGSLGRDPELRFTAGGQALAMGTVAVSHRYQNKEKEWVEETSWIDVTCWGTLGENFAASCTKGTRVIATGRLKQESWEDRDTGTKRTKLSMVCDEIGPSLRWARAEVERIERETT